MPGSSGVPTSSRRAFLQRAGLAVGTGTALALLGPAGGAGAGVTGTVDTSIARSGDPDELFRAGRFEEADRAYRTILRTNPRDAHAAAQVGYIALLSNRFHDAERYLSAAIRLAPDDVATKQRLAECFVRQDQHARAVPILRDTGSSHDQALATQYTHLAGAPWRIHGASSTRLPFVARDPMLSVEATANGGPAKGYTIDTYGTLGLSAEAAEEAGLRAVAEIEGSVGGEVGAGPKPMYLGVLDSFRMGDIELRNVPVHWMDVQRPPLPDGSQPAGVIGTTVLYHLLATMDYAGGALVLRRKTADQLRRVRREAALTGFDRVPLWLAGDHYPCSLGSLRDYGPHVVTLDTGGVDRGIETTTDIAERAGMDVDYDHPSESNGVTYYPTTTGPVSLGRAVNHDVRNSFVHEPRDFGPGPAQSDDFGFDVMANFSHNFFTPFALTFDYTHMHLYMTGDLAAR